MSKKNLLISISVIIIFLILGLAKKENNEEDLSGIEYGQFAPGKENKIEDKPEKDDTEALILPMADADSRITKKPFGIKVNPGNSPIQAERFSGLHTGTDFEIMSDELDEKIKVNAICSGEVLRRNWIKGYGGVIVQKCPLNGRLVTVIYGHLSLTDDFNVQIGDNIASGNIIAILGNDNSVDTDGERKHLHLGIHKGGEVNFKGYVDSKMELEQWINAEDYLEPKND